MHSTDQSTYVNSIWVVIGALLSLFLANYALTGNYNFLLLNDGIPYLYSGDAMYTQWVIKRVSEGWIFTNERTGYPFNADYYDFPGADFGLLLIIKMLCMVGFEWSSVFNILVILSFPIVFAVTFLVCRSFGLVASVSFMVAVLFNFVPFHLHRIVHTYYLWYFVIPLFFYVGYRWILIRPKINFMRFIALMPLSFFGVYYAVFGSLVIVFSTLASYFKYKMNLKVLIVGGLFVLSIFIGVLIQLLPNLYYFYENGRNPLFVSRSPLESEVYALKLRHLIFPRLDHFFGFLRGFHEPFTSGNALDQFYSYQSTPGLLGSLGILISLPIIMSMIFGYKFKVKIKFVALMTWFLILFGMSGGLGAVFAIVVSPQIRAWDRISIFIAFAALLFFSLLLQFLLCKLKSSRSSFVVNIVAILLAVVFLVEQIYPIPKYVVAPTREKYLSDRDFVKSVEESLDVGSALYVFPHVPFSDLVGPRFNLTTYDFARIFLHSNNIKINSGGFRGRVSESFYSNLDKMPLDEQIKIAKKMGFSGLIIMGNGYEDGGNMVIDQINLLLNKKPEITGVGMFFYRF